VLSKQFHCSDCGGLDGFRSRPRTFAEKYILPMLLLRPVRCADCFRRKYQIVFVDARERTESEVTRKAAA
jgi:hypothetical protein